MLPQLRVANRFFRAPWWRLSRFNLFIVLLCCLLFFLEHSCHIHQLQGLGLQPSSVQLGAWWQVLTAHLVHFTSFHLLWNLAALVVIMFAFEKEQQPIEDAIFLVFCSAMVGVMLYNFVPEIREYRGLSGVLYGYVVFYALKSYASYRYFALMILGFITLRLIWQMTGHVDQQSAIAKLGGSISVEAHQFGYLAGWLGYFFKKAATKFVSK